MFWLLFIWGEAMLSEQTDPLLVWMLLIDALINDYPFAVGNYRF